MKKIAIFSQKWSAIAARKNVDQSNLNYKVNMDFTKIFIYVKSLLISAELFELNFKVQLNNLVRVTP